VLTLKKSIAPKIIDSTIINISGIEILLLRKNIKNINFSVSSKKAQVRVSAPKNISNDELLIALHSRLDWMRNKIQIVNNLPKQPDHNYSSGEKHYFLGKLYKLDVIEQTGKPNVSIQSPGILTMSVRENTTRQSKEILLNEWYRAELKQRIPLLIEKWQPIIGKKISEWGIKKMKTRWGTCNINKKRIWLNLELAKQPEVCLEYVVVHEMTHLLERNHNARFKSLLDGFIPDWRRIEAILNTNNIKGDLLEEK
jgi:predicted metal-dependent hydrolase